MRGLRRRSCATGNTRLQVLGEVMEERSGVQWGCEHGALGDGNVDVGTCLNGAHLGLDACEAWIEYPSSRVSVALPLQGQRAITTTAISSATANQHAGTCSPYMGLYVGNLSSTCYVWGNTPALGNHQVASHNTGQDTVCPLLDVGGAWDGAVGGEMLVAQWAAQI
jgi:hypothetical protein